MGQTLVFVEVSVFAVDQGGGAPDQRLILILLQAAEAVPRPGPVVKQVDRPFPLRGGIQLLCQSDHVPVAAGEGAEPGKTAQTVGQNGGIDVDRALRKPGEGEVLPRLRDGQLRAVHGIGAEGPGQGGQDGLPQLAGKDVPVGDVLIVVRPQAVAVEGRRGDDHRPAGGRVDHVVQKVGGVHHVARGKGVILGLDQPVVLRAAHAVQQDQHVIALRGIVAVGEIDRHLLFDGLERFAVRSGAVVCGLVGEHEHSAGVRAGLEELARDALGLKLRLHAAAAAEAQQKAVRYDLAAGEAALCLQVVQGMRTAQAAAGAAAVFPGGMRAGRRLDDQVRRPLRLGGYRGGRRRTLSRAAGQHQQGKQQREAARRFHEACPPRRRST